MINQPIGNHTLPIHYRQLGHRLATFMTHLSPGGGDFLLNFYDSQVTYLPTKQ